MEYGLTVTCVSRFAKGKRINLDQKRKIQVFIRLEADNVRWLWCEHTAVTINGQQEIFRDKPNLRIYMCHGECRGIDAVNLTLVAFGY